MKLHGNAALSLKKRRLLCQRVVGQEWSLTEAAAAAEVSERTAGKWVARFRAEGDPGLLDRSSAANKVHNRSFSKLRAKVRKWRLRVLFLRWGSSSARSRRFRGAISRASRSRFPWETKESQALKQLAADLQPRLAEALLIGQPLGMAAKVAQ